MYGHYLPARDAETGRLRAQQVVALTFYCTACSEILQGWTFIRRKLEILVTIAFSVSFLAPRVSQIFPSLPSLFPPFKHFRVRLGKCSPQTLLSVLAHRSCRHFNYSSRKSSRRKNYYLSLRHVIN